MTTDEIREKIKQFIAKFTRKPNIDDDTDHFATGLVNSLFAMQLVLFVEKEFGIKVENEDLKIDNFRTANAITRLVASKLEAESPVTA